MIEATMTATITYINPYFKCEMYKLEAPSAENQNCPPAYDKDNWHE